MYQCTTNCHEYFQIRDAAPSSLKFKARSQGQNLTSEFGKNYITLILDEDAQIDFQEFKAKDYYDLLLVKKLQSLPTGPEK